MWVMTRHAAKLVITLDKALALGKTIRLKTISRLLGKFVKLCDGCRRPVAFPARVIDDLAALVGEFVEQQSAGFVASCHRLCMRRARSMTRLTPDTEKAWLRNQARIRTRHRVTPDTVHRIIHPVRLANGLVTKVFLPWRHAEALLTGEPRLANLNTATRMHREKCHPRLAATQH